MTDNTLYANDEGGFFVSRTVLFVDDDPNLLTAMARSLRKTSYQVLTAETLDQANHLLQTRRVDAVVSDAVMPGISGTEFLSKIAQHYPDIVRILLTGHPSLPLAAEAINRGRVCHFLTKPCNAEALTEILQKTLDERERAQEDLCQAQKMGKLGQMTSGLVHNFNNLLTIINGCSEVALKNMDKNNPCCEPIELIQKAGDRAVGLTRQILAFSRQDKAQAQAFGLNEMVSDMEKILVRLIGNKTELITVLAPNLPQAYADPSQLEQALVNLTANARDAMRDGGELTITTSASDRKPRMPEDGQHSQEHFVMISVKDSGCGMDEETRKRVFEPFFTTKPPGRGTGLGLAMVNDFVRQCGGFIELQSSPGKGSTFTLHIPAVVKPNGQPSSATPISS